jgi:transposase
VARLEVISSGARRRWTPEEKHRIVAESYDAPRQVSATARRNGLSASQLFTWRRLARDGRLAAADEEQAFVPAMIGDDSPPPSSCAALGRIEIVLLRGHRVLVDNGVDTAVLARVLAVLERP